MPMPAEGTPLEIGKVVGFTSLTFGLGGMLVDELVREAVIAAKREAGPARKRMPRERQSITHKFSIGGHEGYITAGMYDDGSVGEIFLTDIGKEGSTLRGMMNSFATAISIALQYGVPLEAYVSKFVNMRFEPAGLTDDPDIRMAQSMMDYIFRRLALDYLPYEKRAALGIFTADERAEQVSASYGSTAPAAPAAVTSAADVEEELETLAQSAPVESPVPSVDATPAGAAPAPVTAHSSAELLEVITGKSSDAPLCMTCGIKMRPAGSCYVCEGCGSTSGCS